MGWRKVRWEGATYDGIGSAGGEAMCVGVGWGGMMMVGSDKE